MNVRQVIVCSVLSEPSGMAVVPYLLRDARAQATGLGLSGAMLFDGERVVVFLEGAPAVAREMLELTQRHPASAETTLVHDAIVAGGPRLRRWMAGYVEAGVLEALCKACADSSSGQHPVDVFLRVLADADVE